MSYEISFHRQMKFDYWKKKLESLSLGLDISEDKTFFFFCMTYDDHFILLFNLTEHATLRILGPMILYAGELCIH